MKKRARKSPGRGRSGSPHGTAPSPPRRRRMDPADRERQIVDGAVAFFAEVGFDGSLRDLAKRLGITHQNLFRYFPTKEALIERVYQEGYRWRPEWDGMLGDRSQPLESRLIEFYRVYTAALFKRDWIRIVVFAGLRGVDIPGRYLKQLQKMVLEPMAFELRTLAGLPEEPDRPLSPDELQIAWALHAQMFYPAILRFAYGMKAADDFGRDVGSTVGRYLRGAPAAMREARARS